MGGGCGGDKEKPKVPVSEKRKSDEGEQMKDLKKVSRRTLIEFRICQMSGPRFSGLLKYCHFVILPRKL